MMPLMSCAGETPHRERDKALCGLTLLISLTSLSFSSRSVIPYAHSPSVRKLSKIATLLLAKNYILMQQNALEELRR